MNTLGTYVFLFFFCDYSEVDGCLSTTNTTIEPIYIFIFLPSFPSNIAIF